MATKVGRLGTKSIIKSVATIKANAWRTSNPAEVTVTATKPASHRPGARQR
jgi:hypothetical protein